MIIETKNLCKSFQVGSEKVQALKGVDLAVQKGEFLSIMGPSGSGKTTLMNIIGCLDTPTSGTYHLNNKLVNELDDDELAMIRNKEITRDKALEMVSLPPIPGQNIKQYENFFKKKLQLSNEEFEKIMLENPKNHSDYDIDIYNNYLFQYFKKLIKKIL